MATKEKRRRSRPAAAQTAAPRRSRPVRKARKLRDQDVVYTPPKPFKQGKFILHLITVTAVVLAVVFGMSIFFKVQTIQVSGCNKYTPWDVSEASGIETGENLLTLSRAQISGTIMAGLPYVDSVRVGIILPDTVNIEITELDVVYAVEDSEGLWWLINEDGKVVEQTNAVTAKEYTRILGVHLQPPTVGQQAAAQEPEKATLPVFDPEAGTQEGQDQTGSALPEDLLEDTISVGVSAAEQLQTAMTVLKELGNHNIVGQVDSVDVTGLSSIELWYDDRFQVNLGDISRVDYKVAALKAAINKMESYESGNLDVSFTNWPDKVGYTPFT